MNQTSSTAWKDCSRIPVFSILNLPLSIPKQHSTSFRILSAHLDHLCSSIVAYCLYGGIVQLHLRYPPSTYKIQSKYIAVWTGATEVGECDREEECDRAVRTGVTEGRSQ